MPGLFLMWHWHWQWQDEVKEQDFDIEAEAKAALVPCAKSYNVSVTNGRLEIRFYWAGKGTQAIPDRGTHGPLISAISLENLDFDQAKKKNNVVPIVVGITGAFLVVCASGILLWRYHFKAKNQREKGLHCFSFFHFKTNNLCSLVHKSCLHLQILKV